MLKPGRAHSGAVLAGWLAAAVQTVGLLWPSWGSGQLLYRDFVAVPNPVWSARVIGADGSAPRAVPLDFVTTLLAQVLPSGVQQQVMLSATLLLAGGGVTMLLRRFGWVATVTAATLASWSPYAGERLLLGQPPTLLAWSMLPWLVCSGPVERATSGVAAAGGAGSRPGRAHPVRWAGRPRHRRLDRRDRPDLGPRATLRQQTAAPR
jgi:hypothetical protein